MTIWERILWRYSDEASRRVAELLLSEPAKWSSARGYELEHESGKLNIWIANSAYGLSYEAVEHISPGWFSRHLIWRYVKRLNVPSPGEFKSRLALAAMPKTTA